MWTRNTIDFGQIKGGSTNIASTQYKGDKKIVKVSASCGCTAATARNNVLTITYKAGEYPRYKELLDNSPMESTKTIKITYDDNTNDLITIKAQIVP